MLGSARRSAMERVGRALLQMAVFWITHTYG